MPKFRYVGPADHVAIIDGRPVALDVDQVVDIPEGSSPDLWQPVADEPAAPRQSKKETK